jgi:glycosidase
MPRRAQVRRLVLTLLAVVATAVALVAPSALPASAEHTPLPSRVTLMGSLMDELGCGAEWDETCDATDMTRVGDTAVFELVATVPAGSYEFKVRLNGSWAENYGDSEGTYDKNGNIPLPLEGAAKLRFTYDHDTHAVKVEPADPPAPLGPADQARAGSSLRKDLTKERFYFVMADRFENGLPANDTGGLTGGRLSTGLDPADKAFYHGGDLRGLIDQLDYIEDLGTTALWMTPSFKNKPVQGTPGAESAGYHGYWITDFTQIDPHLGSNADLKELIGKAHQRGIKVFFDIITNHTADVLDYPPDEYVGAPGNQSIPYVSKAEEPYRDAEGNDFDDREYASGNDFPDVSAATSFPYVPTFRSEADKTVKVPGWLNDPTMYHNRGTSSFTGENSEYGDFPGGDRQALDDLWTERPQVVNGMIDIYKTWVQDAGVDGFRIDTVKHVNMQFWQRFGPALQGYAASLGNDDFFMFGEVFDANPAFMSQYTTEGRLQATVDFGFQSNVSGFAKGEEGKTASSAQTLAKFFAADDWYTDSDSNAYSLPTFLGNHDMGRIGKFLRDAGNSGSELLDRDLFAHSLMYVTRGQPVVYYGDEQGFTGDGGDQDAREDMFPSRVASYNDNDLIGTDATTADANFDAKHPLYRHISRLADLRAKHPTLADGAQVTRYADTGPGIFAFSRISAGEDVEYVVAANSADATKTATFPTYSEGMTFTKLWPTPAGSRSSLRSDGDGQVTVQVPGRSVSVYRATRALGADSVSPTPSVVTPQPGQIVEERTPITVDVPQNDLQQVSVLWRPVGTSEWRPLGTDDNAPYRVYQDVRGFAKGSLLEYRVVVRDHDGDLGVASSWAVVGNAPEVSAPVSAVPQPNFVSVPGRHGSELGCPDSADDDPTNPGDWSPSCEAVQLQRGSDDDIWSRTFQVPVGDWAFKAAINKSWDENYGAKGVLGGQDIGYQTTSAGPVTFYYDHRTHWVTNDLLDDIVVATGTFQSEMGCPADNAVDCLRGWLQDPDDDGVYSLWTTEVPPGTYDVRPAVDGALVGSAATFTVAAGDATRFTYDAGTQTIAVVTAPPPPTG